MTAYRFDRPARDPKAAAAILAIWTGLVLVWIGLEASPWIIAPLMALTLPAAWDFAHGRESWLALDDTQMRWRSGRHEGAVALARLDHVRFETRLDLSIRVRLVLDSQQRLTVPQDALPPRETLEKELESRGIKTRRHHFSLL